CLEAPSSISYWIICAHYCSRREITMAVQHPEVSMLPRASLIAGNRKTEQGGGELHGHVYPGTGRITREVRLCDAADVDAAVSAARAAFPAWKALPGDKRRDLMFKLAALCEQRMQEL